MRASFDPFARTVVQSSFYSLIDSIKGRLSHARSFFLEALQLAAGKRDIRMASDKGDIPSFRHPCADRHSITFPTVRTTQEIKNGPAFAGRSEKPGRLIHFHRIVTTIQPDECLFPSREVSKTLPPDWTWSGRIHLPLQGRTGGNASIFSIWTGQQVSDRFEFFLITSGFSLQGQPSSMALSLEKGEF